MPIIPPPLSTDVACFSVDVTDRNNQLAFFVVTTYRNETHPDELVAISERDPTSTIPLDKSFVPITMAQNIRVHATVSTSTRERVPNVREWLEGFYSEAFEGNIGIVILPY